MKKLIYICVASILTGLLITGCQPSETEEHTLIPVQDLGILQAEQEVPDDIMPVPGGGPAYRANVHQQGVENPWPSIEISETYLGGGANEAHIYYRSSIETAAEETRNNVIKLIIPGKEVNSLALYADNVTQGITLIDGMQWSGPSSRASVLVIEIAADVAPGKYPLEIGLIINGKDYGMVTCTINVIPEEVQPQDSSYLKHARPYRILSEGNLANEDPGRSVGLWFITSEEASGFEEYAQTAVQAVLDLYRLYGRDYTSVLLLPSDKLEYAGLSYAQAKFAADGKGAAGMTGDAPAKEHYWKVRAADRELNERELAIAELWVAKQQDFPQPKLWSSLSYDEEALRHYIADTLNIPYGEVQMPGLEMQEYELNQLFVDETVSQAASFIPGNPRTEIALESLRETGNLGDSERAIVNSLVNDIPEELKSQFATAYGTAEKVSRDSRWMIYSSWRPYTQSDEYQQLLGFCREQEVVWLLLFQQLDSENPYFAGGLILDVTIPEYLYYFEESGRQSNMQEAKPDFSAYTKELVALLQGDNHEK